MEIVSLKKVSRASKELLLGQLGYGSDGRYVLKDGKRWVDKYVGEEVTLDNMLVLPGSTVVITDNPVSVAAYFEEYGDWD